MADRYLKNVKSGEVFIWQGVFAENADFVEVTDASGRQEKHAADEAKPVRKVRAKKPAGLGDLDFDESSDAQTALESDATVGL